MESNSWLADEIHDGPLQLLIAARMLLETGERPLVTSKVPSGSKTDSESSTGEQTVVRASEETIPAERLIDDAISQLRQIMDRLEPTHLTAFGFKAALEALADRFFSQVDVRFEFDFPPEELSHETELDLYRIIQASIANSIQHGKATRVDISMIATADQLRVRIADNGVDMPVCKQDDNRLKRPKGKEGGRGLNSLARRVANLGGSWEIDQGWQISITLPWPC